MTTVNVTTTANTVTVTEDGSSTVVQNPVTTVVTATTAGPQGPAGAGFTLNQPLKWTRASSITTRHLASTELTILGLLKPSSLEAIFKPWPTPSD